MESQSESKTPLLKQRWLHGLVVALVSIVGIVLMLMFTRGSQFCIFTIGSCVDQAGSSIQHGISTGAEALAIAAGAAAAVVLVTVVEAPVIVAIGVAIAIGLVAGQFF